MILNNIIIPLKHPYISPEVTFEEMEGEGMLIGTGDATGSNGGKGEGETEDPNGDIEEAKESTFIWDDEFDINIEQ